MVEDGGAEMGAEKAVWNQLQHRNNVSIWACQITDEKYTSHEMSAQSRSQSFICRLQNEEWVFDAVVWHTLMTLCKGILAIRLQK